MPPPFRVVVVVSPRVIYEVRSLGISDPNDIFMRLQRLKRYTMAYVMNHPYLRFIDKMTITHYVHPAFEHGRWVYHFDISDDSGVTYHVPIN